MKVQDVKRGDMTDGHPDFNVISGKYKRAGHVPGLMLPDLGGDGKPVFNPSRRYNQHGNDPIVSAATFDQWYNTTDGVNLEIPVTVRFGPKADAEGVYTTEG